MLKCYQKIIISRKEHLIRLPLLMRLFSSDVAIPTITNRIMQINHKYQPMKFALDSYRMFISCLKIFKSIKGIANSWVEFCENAN